MKDQFLKEFPVTRWIPQQLFCSIQIYFWQNHSDKGGLEILYDCADGIDRDGDLDLADGELDAYRDKKSAKELNQLEVAIGDGMEFTIHGKIEKRSIFRISYLIFQIFEFLTNSWVSSVILILLFLKIYNLEKKNATASTVLSIIKWKCFFLFFFEGDLKNKLKKGKLCMNNSKVIANSINHRDYRLDNDYINQNEDDTIRWLSFSVLWSFFWIVIEDYYYYFFFF